MDPNANLEELLLLARQLIYKVGRIDQEPIEEADLLDDAERMSELVLALDGWMSGGGFAPRTWQHASR